MPCVYYDGIFAVLSCIVPRYTNPTLVERLINLRMSSLRESIEHIFSMHENMFALFGVPRYLRLYRNGRQVRRLYTISFFIQNCYLCEQGTRCRFFGQVPPTLEDYIPLDEVLIPPPAVDLGDTWQY